MTYTLRVAFFAAAALVLSSCETPPEQESFPMVSFADMAPLTLDVAKIEVEKAYQPPAKAPHVDHEMPVSLLSAAEAWGKQRLRAGGNAGIGRLIIERASVVEERLKTSGGITGVFTTEQSERYKGELSAQLKVWGVGGKGAASAHAVVRMSRTVKEDITLAERERVWFDMVEAMALQMNREMESQIKRHMGAYLK